MAVWFSRIATISAVESGPFLHGRVDLGSMFQECRHQFLGDPARVATESNVSPL